MSFCPLTEKPCNKDCDWYNTGDSYCKGYSGCSVKILASNTAIIMDILNEKAKIK